MPLNRANMTLASRVMVPTYPLFLLGIATSLLFTPLERLRATPGFNYADAHGGLRLWGAGFLVVAVLLLIARLAEKRAAYVAGLAVMLGWMAVWALLLVAAAAHGTSSWSAWMWPAFVAIVCWATMLSLLAKES